MGNTARSFSPGRFFIHSDQGRQFEDGHGHRLSDLNCNRFLDQLVISVTMSDHAEQIQAAT
jgi:hypothetical protein